ncbi:MAG: V-type ATP synthase subunit E, partial [Treponema sp.]|nr:V-type ATP synthase subunit E [Treponema sp.]
QEASSAFSGDVLKEALPGLVKGWASGAETLDVILPEGELRALDAYFQDKLAAEFKRGLELKPDRNLAAGFRIANKDGSAYYDFSADAVVELLSAYLNPRLAEILKDSAKGI